MESTKALVGTALLNVYWKTRRKDLLDLITPFINYCTAQVVTPEKSPCKKNQISLGTVTEKVRKEFGYVDIPAAIVEKIYKRDQKHYCKNGGNYYLIEPFDDLVERMDKKRLECAEMVDNLGKSLLCYLKSHCQKEKACVQSGSKAHEKAFRVSLPASSSPNQLHSQMRAGVDTVPA